MANTADLSRGAFIRYDGELCVVLEYEHRTPGNLRAFFQVKMRNVRTGKLAEHRFRAGESIEFVRVDNRKLQYLYREGDSLVCMDNESYDQIPLPAHVFGDQVQYLKESMEVTVSFEGDTPLQADVPATVELEVTHTEPGLKGDTATRTLKPATLETGATIKVPIFVNIGDRLKIDTRTGEYLARA